MGIITAIYTQGHQKGEFDLCKHPQQGQSKTQGNPDCKVHMITVETRKQHNKTVYKSLKSRHPDSKESTHCSCCSDMLSPCKRMLSILCYFI